MLRRFLAEVLELPITLATAGDFGDLGELMI